MYLHLPRETYRAPWCASLKVNVVKTLVAYNDVQQHLCRSFGRIFVMFWMFLNMCYLDNSGCML